MIRTTIFLMALCLPTLGFADDDTTEDVGEGTVTGGSAPVLELEEPEEEDKGPSTALSSDELARIAALPYEAVDYRGGEILGLEPEFIHEARQGLEMIYLRDYKGARDHFAAMSEEHQASAIGPIGDGLVWQAMMLENFDFKYESQYEYAFSVAKDRLHEDEDSAFNSFLTGGVMGIEAIHMTRRGNFVTALSKGLDALQAMKKCREEAPDYPDLLLADGIYNYWRSVVTLNSKVLPDFEDKRAEGIQQLNRARKEAIFVGPPAGLALVFSYMEERKMKMARSVSYSLHNDYPDNVINNMVLARIHIYTRKYQSAENVLDQIKEDAPKNERIYYYYSLVYSRTKRLDEAIASIDQYLTYDLGEDYRASALYRRGRFSYQKKEYAEAEAFFKEAWKLNRHKASKKRLDRMKDLKKEGRIEY